MRAKKGTVRSIIIALVIAFVAVNVLGYLSGIGYVMWDVIKGKQREMRLLCETDHQALLKACRKLLSRVSRGDLKPQQYNIRLNPHPEASNFPQEILDLKPTYIIITSDGRMMIELHGGFLHYGVWAYPEDYKAPFINYNYGDIKIIDGLWYYDEDYEDSPKNRKKVEALIQKGNMKNQAKD